MAIDLDDVVVPVEGDDAVHSLGTDFARLLAVERLRLRHGLDVLRQRGESGVELRRLIHQSSIRWAAGGQGCGVNITL